MSVFTNRPNPTSPVLSEADFCDRLGQVRAGDHFVYHVGFLACDVSPETSRLTESDRAELVRVARRARQAADQGLVVLAQTRLGREMFSYLAIARRRPKPKRVSLKAVVAK